MRVGVGVILVLQHDIFKGDAPGVGGAGVIGTGLQQLLDAELLVDRHDFVAHLLGDRVKRDCQIDADFLPAAFHHRHDAAGRQGDAPFGQGQTVAVHHQLQRIADIVEIIQRLAHAHHYDIGQQAAVSGILRLALVIRQIHAPLGPFAQRITRQHHLADDFARRQVAHQPHGSGVAEPAIEGAANLAGHAQRAAIGVGDEDHFEIMAISRAQQPFARAIGGMLRLYHFGATDDETLAQPGTHGLGDIRHRLEISDAAMIQPVEHLLGAQPGLFCI